MVRVKTQVRPEIMETQAKETFIFANKILGRTPGGVVAHLLDCDIAIKEIELQLLYYFHFRIDIHKKGMNTCYAIQLFVK